MADIVVVQILDNESVHFFSTDKIRLWSLASRMATWRLPLDRFQRTLDDLNVIHHTDGQHAQVAKFVRRAGESLPSGVNVVAYKNRVWEVQMTSVQRSPGRAGVPPRGRDEHHTRCGVAGAVRSNEPFRVGMRVAACPQPSVTEQGGRHIITERD